MKNVIAFICFFSFVFFAQSAANAQRTATWKGGTPGKANEWNCPTNWKEGRVPDAFSDVIIPDVATIGGFQPVIRHPEEGVNSLTVLPGAQLRIEAPGALEVFESLELLAGDSILNYGQLNAPLSENTGNTWNAALANYRRN